MTMQQFKSHKVVEAAQIAGIDRKTSGGAILRFSERDGDLVAVSGEWAQRFKPEVGGYYVQYPDGYTSWSPAEAFEEGYSPVMHDPKDGAPPVSGYKPQNAEAVALVNEFKATEERILRGLAEMASQPEKYDPYWLHTGAAALQQAFMFINRAVFKPGRVTLPEDGQ